MFTFNNKNMLKSATKIVLVIMTIAFISLTFYWIIDWKDFVNAFLMILSFYFGWKTATTNNT
jgi:hypothetical protein